MEKLAQPPGNAKICGEFDRDAATAADPNPKDEGSFQRLADLNLTARRKGALALLTEGIAKELCGEQMKKRGVQRRFKPVNELSDAVNAILYDGPQGSPLFENGGCFFDRLESANRSGAGNSKALRAPALQIRECSVPSPATVGVSRRFNGDTQRLAACKL